jgi:hypothetical protein
MYLLKECEEAEEVRQKGRAQRRNLKRNGDEEVENRM